MNISEYTEKSHFYTIFYTEPLFTYSLNFIY